MAHQTRFQSLQSIAGTVLLALGLLILFSNLDAVAASLTAGIGYHASEGVDTFLTIGLATIHAAQSYAFEHSQFVSSVWRILVSCWPLILVFLGALLLRGSFGKLLSGHSTNMGSFANGERS